LSAFRPDEQRSYRALFALLGVAFLASTLWSVWDEGWTRRPWKVWQARYAELRPGAPNGEGITQLVVPPLEVVDRCPTCHLGVDTPGLEGPEISRVLQTHPDPAVMLGKHPVARFGCTPCHRGQGLALTAGKAHGEDDPHWPEPLARGPYVQASCLGCHRDEERLAGAPVLETGRRVFREMGCEACHGVANAPPPVKRGPSLKHVAAKLDPGWLVSWIRAPKVRRATRQMPQFWPHAEDRPEREAQRDAESIDIAAYLLDKSAPFALADAVTSVDETLAEEGHRLFDRLGCRGCHVIGTPGGDELTIREERSSEAASDENLSILDDVLGSDGPAADAPPEPSEAVTPTRPPGPVNFGPPLGDVGARIQAKFFEAWVRDPAAYWKDATMPGLDLTTREARALAAYLTTLRAAEVPPPPDSLKPPYDRAVVERGRKLIAAYGCHGCHEIAGMEDEGRAGPDLSDYGDKDPHDFHFGAEPPPRRERTWERFTEAKIHRPRAFETKDIKLLMPEVVLAEPEALGLAVFLRGLRAKPPPEGYVRADPAARAVSAGERTFAERGCWSCHTFDKEQGRINRYYGDVYLGPPSLDGAGAKLQPQWLFAYLLDPGPMRPWLDVRMPRFRLTPDDADGLCEMFARREHRRVPMRPLAMRAITPARAKLGTPFFEQLKCVQCHMLNRQQGLQTAQLSADLGLSRVRLDPDWVRRFLVDPGKVLPGTKMPQFFPDGRTPNPTLLDGNAQAQIELLVETLFNLGLQPAARDDTTGKPLLVTP